MKRLIEFIYGYLLLFDNYNTYIPIILDTLLK
jgi:hypothetical protein